MAVVAAFVVVESLEWFAMMATSNQATDSSFDLRLFVVVVAFAVASASCCGDYFHSIVIDAEEAIVGVAVKVTS